MAKINPTGREKTREQLQAEAEDELLAEFSDEQPEESVAAAPSEAEAPEAQAAAYTREQLDSFKDQIRTIYDQIFAWQQDQEDDFLNHDKFAERNFQISHARNQVHEIFRVNPGLVDSNLQPFTNSLDNEWRLKYLELNSRQERLESLVAEQKKESAEPRPAGPEAKRDIASEIRGLLGECEAALKAKDRERFVVLARDVASLLSRLTPEEYEEYYKPFKDKTDEINELYYQMLYESDLAAEPPEKTSDERLEEARAEYVRARGEAGAFSRIKQFALGGDSKEKVEKAFAEAQAEYQKLRAEYVGASVDRFVTERMRLIDEKMRAFQESRSAVGKKTGGVYDWYKGLAKYNLQMGLEKIGQEKMARSISDKGGKVGRFALRALNVRTAASFGLLGLGVAAGFTSAVGIGAIAARRVLAGGAASVGSYDLFNLAIEKMDRRGLEKRARQALADGEEFAINDSMAEFESGAILSGKKIEDLKNDPVYQQLLREKVKKMEGEAWVVNTPEWRAGVLDYNLEYLDSKLETQLDVRGMEKKALQFGAKTMAGIVGVTVGSGLLAEMIGNKTGLSRTGAEEEAQVRPAPEAPAAEPRLSEITSSKVQPLEGRSPLADMPSKSPDLPKGPISFEVRTPSVSPPEPLEPGAPAPAPESVPEPASAPPTTETPAEPTTSSPDLPKGPIPFDVKAPPTEAVPAAVAAAAEVQPPAGEDLVIKAGGRGIEGSLLDLKDKDPAKYKSMMSWLGEHYSSETPGGNADDKLIHRFVLDQAPEGGNINRIFDAEVSVGSDGSVEFVDDSVKFMPEELPEEPHLSEVVGTEVQPLDELPDSPEPAGAKTTWDELRDKSAALQHQVDEILKSPRAYEHQEEFMAKQKELMETRQGMMDLMKTEHEDMMERIDAERAAWKEATALSSFGEALTSKLGENYHKFFEQALGTTPESFAEVEKMTIAEFMDKFESSPDEFQNKYGALKDQIEQYQGRHPGHFNPKERWGVGKLALSLAEVWANKQ